MESFGIFDFLKTLFPGTETPPPKAEEKSEEEQLPTETPSGEKGVSSQEAIVRFMQAHEERAKKVRK